MTEFLFDLFITLPIKFISKFCRQKAMSYWESWLLTGCAYIYLKISRLCYLYDLLPKQLDNRSSFQKLFRFYSTKS